MGSIVRALKERRIGAFAGESACTDPSVPDMLSGMKIIMHINYCEPLVSVEDACARAAEWGFDGIEFRARGGDLGTVEYLDRIAAAADRHSLSEITFGGGPSLNHADPLERRAAVERFLEFYEAAVSRFPLKVCNLQTDWLEDKAHPYDHYEKHGSAIATEAMWEWQADGLGQLAAFAVSHGFRFALETHQAYIHDLPASCRKLVDAVGSPGLGVTLDYGNIVGFAQPPSIEECLQSLGDSLAYVHLKNSMATGTRYRQRCGLGEGEINNRLFLQQLTAHGYTGPYCIESPRKGDRHHFAVCDLRYLRELAG